MFQGAQNLFDELNTGIRTIRLNINKYLEQLSKETMRDIDVMSSQLKLIENAGYCGLGPLMRAFTRAVGVFERRLWLWFSLPQLETLKFKISALDEEDIKRFILDLMDSSFPFQGSQTLRDSEKLEKTVNLQISEDLEKLRVAHEYLYGLTRNKNQRKAMDLYRYEAEVNLSQNAYNVLAQLYREGNVVEKDLKSSLEYTLKSAQANNPIGIYWYSKAILVRLLLYIYSFKQNQNELDQIGVYFVNDTERINEGKRLLRQAAESGLSEALTDLANIVEKGLNRDGEKILQSPDPDMALDLHSKACQTMNSRSCYHYAIFCLKYKEKYQQAINLLERSIELGFGPAFFELGLCYLRGIGVIENEQKALEYIKRGAIELFDRDCVEKYAEYIVEKLETEFKSSESIIFIYDFLREALKRQPDNANVSYALVRLPALKKYWLSNISSNFAIQISILGYRQGAEIDHLDCIIKVARCYYNGTGTHEDLKASKVFYEKAARLSQSEVITQNIVFESIGNAQGTESLQEQFILSEEYKKKNSKSSFHRNPHVELSQHQPVSVIDNDFPSRSQIELENYRKSGLNSPIDLSWGVKFAESDMLFKESSKKQSSYQGKKIIKNPTDSLLVSDFVNSKQLSNAFVGYPQQHSLVSQEYGSIVQFDDLK